jgi:protein-arginine kinase activator protein McsA
MNIECQKCKTQYPQEVLNVVPQKQTEIRFVCKVCSTKNSVRFEEKSNWYGKVALTPVSTATLWDLQKESVSN